MFLMLVTSVFTCNLCKFQTLPPRNVEDVQRRRSEPTHIVFSRSTGPHLSVTWQQQGEFITAKRGHLVLLEHIEGRKELFYLTTHSTHFIYGYMASDIW